MNWQQNWENYIVEEFHLYTIFTADFALGGTKFESWLGHSISWEKFFMLFWLSARTVRQIDIQPHHLQFIIHWLLCHFTLCRIQPRFDSNTPLQDKICLFENSIWACNSFSCVTSWNMWLSLPVSLTYIQCNPHLRFPFGPAVLSSKLIKTGSGGNLTPGIIETEY
jgi:hypothetical protein